MTEPENHTIRLLQELRSVLDDRFRRLDEAVGDVSATVAELRLRLTAVETQNVAILSHLDRLSGDVVQIKKRLDLVEA